MKKPRGIYLPDEVWSAYERLAIRTHSVPTRGTNAGQKPSLNALLRRIGEDEVLLGVVADWLNGNRNEHAEGRPTIVLRPLEPSTETIAWVEVQSNLVCVTFPENRDDFKEIVKGLDYDWKVPRWERLIEAKHGTPLDRAAELCHRLLAGGFCVSPPNVAVRDKAIMADYQLDGKRWISTLRHNTDRRRWFLLRWSRREDMYDAAMRITAAYYDKAHGGVRVPSEHYDEVLDFAERYEFVVNDAARRLAQDAQAMRNSALLVTTYKPIDPPTLANDRPVLVAEDFGVDDDLADPHYTV